MDRFGTFWSMFAAIAGFHFSAQTARTDEIPPLTYVEIKEFVKQGIKADEIVYSPPAILRKSMGKTTETHVFLGKPARDTFDHDFPALRAFEIQFCLEAMRTQLFANADGKQFIAKACDDAEDIVKQLVLKSGALTFNEAEKIERQIWDHLYQEFDQYFKASNENFQGLVYEPLTVWKPGQLILPFQNVHMAPSAITLKGQPCEGVLNHSFLLARSLAVATC